MTLVFVKHFLDFRADEKGNHMDIKLWDERKEFHQSLKWLPPGEIVIRFLESVMLLQDLQTYRLEVSWKFSIQLHQHTAPCTRNDWLSLNIITDRYVFII